MIYINTSTIPQAGNGLFSNTSFKKGDIIAEFTGDILNEEELETLTELEALYLIDMGDGDSLYCKNCLAASANDASIGKTGFKNNSEIKTGEDGKVYLMATKKINVGDEIFCGYGKQYWKDFYWNLENVLGFPNS